MCSIARPDPRCANIANFRSLDAARRRHLGTAPHPERCGVDPWTDEFTFLSRAGQARIEEDLFFD